MSSEEPDHVVPVDSVAVRRSPRYWRFILVGAALGVILALVLTFAFPATEAFTRLQTFGFLALVAGALCGIIGAVIALLVDSRSRSVPVRIERETYHGGDAN